MDDDPTPPSSWITTSSDVGRVIASLVPEDATTTIETHRKQWSKSEDELIRSMVDSIGFRWRQIAARLPGRSDDAIRNRWARLNPQSANTLRAPATTHRRAVETRTRWTRAEDDTLVSLVWSIFKQDVAYASLKKSERRAWSTIADQLPGRTPHACRNRHHRLMTI